MKVPLLIHCRPRQKAPRSRLQVTQRRMTSRWRAKTGTCIRGRSAWFVCWSVGRLVDWLVGWLVGRLLGCSAAWLVGTFVRGFVRACLRVARCVEHCHSQRTATSAGSIPSCASSPSARTPETTGAGLACAVPPEEDRTNHRRPDRSTRPNKCTNNNKRTNQQTTTHKATMKR